MVVSDSGLKSISPLLFLIAMIMIPQARRMSEETKDLSTRVEVGATRISSSCSSKLSLPTAISMKSTTDGLRTAQAMRLAPMRYGEITLVAPARLSLISDPSSTLRARINRSGLRPRAVKGDVDVGRFGSDGGDQSFSPLYAGLDKGVVIGSIPVYE